MTLDNGLLCFVSLYYLLLLFRAKMEAELKTFVDKKRNVLGIRIQSRVAELDRFMKDQTLILQ